MAIEIFKELGPEITAVFAEGGYLEKSGDIWTYERDGRIGVSIQPELAITGAEGLFNGKVIWNSMNQKNMRGGE